MGVGTSTVGRKPGEEGQEVNISHIYGSEEALKKWEKYGKGIRKYTLSK